MAIDWVVFPLLLVAVCLGCGLTVERVSGWRLPGVLLPAVGLALVTVAAAFTTNWRATAPACTAVVTVLALAGYATSWRRLLSLHLDPWASAVALAVFAVCAAPVVLSGNATFLGYFVDSDTGFHLVLASWVTAHGRDLTGVPPPSTSAVAALLRGYLGTAYPTGADVAVGAIRPLAGQDLAWIYQPYLAVVMALGAVALDELLAGVVRSRPLRATAAAVAALGGLAYAFYLEASAKEVVIALLLTVIVALALRTPDRPLRARPLAALAVVSLAALDVYSVAIVPWVGPPLAVFAVVSLWRARVRARSARTRRRWRLTWSMLAWPAGAAAVVALAAPVISGASTFAAVSSAVLSSNDLGNLAAPLSGWQLFGIWPSGDFRYPVYGKGAAVALLAIAVAATALGAIWMVRRRASAPLLLLVGNAVAGGYLLTRASPYAASKVLMLVSVPVVLTAMLGATALHDAGRRIRSLRIAGWLLAAAIALGVLWTTALAYHDSSVAPEARLRELASIGERFSGQGTAFYNLWDTLAVYFLRREWVTVPGAFVDPAPLVPGSPEHVVSQASSPWDPNEVLPDYLQGFRLLVLGRSPVGSRPPADYALAFRGRFYDVWRRTPRPLVLRHVGFSRGAYPDSMPSCRAILATAAVAARGHARLAYATRRALPTLVPTRAAHPFNWTPTRDTTDGPDDFLSLAHFPGALTGSVRVPAAGRYQVWVEGTLSGPLELWLGTQFAGSLSHQIGTTGQFSYLGTITAQPGDQPVEINRPPRLFGPESATAAEWLGRVVLAPDRPPPPVEQIDPARARSLCGRLLDWVEVVR